MIAWNLIQQISCMRSILFGGWMKSQPMWKCSSSDNKSANLVNSSTLLSPLEFCFPWNVDSVLSTVQLCRKLVKKCWKQPSNKQLICNDAMFSQFPPTPFLFFSACVKSSLSRFKFCTFFLFIPFKQVFKSRTIFYMGFPKLNEINVLLYSCNLSRGLLWIPQHAYIFSSFFVKKWKIC